MEFRRVLFRSVRRKGNPRMSSTHDLRDPVIDADRFEADDEADALLVGAVDLHQHPGPSPFPRRMSIADAARDAAGAGFRAIVVKSHHQSMVTDILALEPEVLSQIPISVYGGIALNHTVGGLNPYAVELALRMGGRVVWVPTLASPAHIDHHAHTTTNFPTAQVQLRENPPIHIADEDGRLRPEARDVLDVIAAERSEEHTSELQSLMRISYAVFCLKKKTKTQK